MAGIFDLLPHIWKHNKRGLRHLLMGKEEKIEKLSALTNRQKKYLDDLLGQLRGQDINLRSQPLFTAGESYLQNLLSESPEAYESFKAPMMREFQEQIVPSISERFAGLGAGSSSGLEQTLARAGESLGERLGSLRTGMQMQALPQALGYAQAPGSQAFRFGSLAMGTHPFGYRESGGYGGMLGGMGQGMGQALPAALMTLL